MPLAHSEERLMSLLATLEECRAFLMDKASPEAARLLSLAILELRTELHHVTDAELKALCDLMVADVQSAQDTKADQGQRLPPYLKLIK
jgi:predicted negative regulator of RcsB-dependent stress response